MNYAQVRDIALLYADRKDVPLVNLMPSFSLIVESRLNRVLHIEDLSTRLVFPTPEPADGPFDGRYALPDNFSSLQDIAIVSIASPTSRSTLALVNSEQMNTVTGVTNQGIKRWYQIIANEIVVQPVPTSDYVLEIVYYATISQLSVSITTTNWLSLYHPDVYIFGLLVEISSYVKDETATAFWDQRFKSAIDEVNAADDLLVWSGTPIFTHVG